MVATNRVVGARAPEAALGVADFLLGTTALVDLFTELDARLQTGYYRGPGVVTTPAGTLL